MDTLGSLGGIVLPILAAAVLLRSIAVVAFAIVAVRSKDEVQRAQAIRVLELLLAKGAAEQRPSGKSPHLGSGDEPRTPPP